jgi:uncharacterized protein
MRRRDLQVDVAALSEAGLDIPLNLGEDWFSAWQAEDPELPFPEPGVIQGSVHVEKLGRDLLVRGHLAGILKLSCSRCLAVYDEPVQADFDILLVPGPEPLMDEEELSEADLDLDYYSGETVELEGLIREQVILLIPLKPLCAETCRGLCPRCGADLNREPCTCEAAKSESPFAALAKLKV